MIWQLARKIISKKFSQRVLADKLKTNISIISRSDSVLKKDKLFLDQNLHIGRLAKEVGTNRTYLSRSIKSIKGMTFTDYINFQRIAYAKEYLVKNPPDITIDDLAIVSGFGSKRNFIRYFKRSEGITPGQYMKGLMVRQK